MYYAGKKLVEIASQLNLPPGTIRRWKSEHHWDSERSENKSERSVKRKRGGQPGNKNADGGPPGNKHAEKYGFFSKWLPAETLDIINAIDDKSPIDLLWDQIQMQYAAIIRAQQIAYVKDRDDFTKVKTKDSYSKDGGCEEWEYQQAWDKHNNFLQAQSRAMATLNGLIKQYDEMLHHDWNLVTEEQRQRVEKIRADVRTKSGASNTEALNKLDEVLSEIKGVV